MTTLSSCDWITPKFLKGCRTVIVNITQQTIFVHNFCEWTDYHRCHKSEWSPQAHHILFRIIKDDEGKKIITIKINKNLLKPEQQIIQESVFRI